MPKKPNSEQLSLEIDYLAKKRSEYLTESFVYLGKANQKYHLSDEQMIILRKRLRLGQSTIDSIYNEIYGLSDASKDEYAPDELLDLLQQEEVLKARNYIKNAKLDEIKSDNARQDACFYCHSTIQNMCTIPNYPDRDKLYMFRFEYPDAEARRRFLGKLAIEPNAVCCPSVDK